MFLTIAGGIFVGIFGVILMLFVVNLLITAIDSRVKSEIRWRFGLEETHDIFERGLRSSDTFRKWVKENVGEVLDHKKI